MNVPHDKICVECGSYMDWSKDHYECPNCGYIGRKMWRWAKVASVIVALFATFYLIGHFLVN